HLLIRSSPTIQLSAALLEKVMGSLVLLTLLGGDPLPRSLADDVQTWDAVEEDAALEWKQRLENLGMLAAFQSSPDDQEPPHDSFEGFFATHFSGAAWAQNVWHDYLTQPPVIFPLALGAGAAARELSPLRPEVLRSYLSQRLRSFKELSHFQF